MSRGIIEWFAPDAAQAYNDWRLVSLNEWPVAWWWAVGLVLALAVVASAWGWRRLPARSRAAIAALRVVAAVIVAGLFLQPGIELRAVSPIRGQVLAFFDASRSMGIATRGGTRAEVALQHWKDSADVLDALEAKATIEAFTFGDGSQPADADPDALPSDQPRTRLGRLLSELAWQTAGRDIAAVILYSDGADTEGLKPDEARRLAARVDAPIHAVGFSSRDAAPDLAIRRVRTDDFAFVHNTVTIDVEVESRGLDLSRVPLTLKREGSVLQTAEVRLEAGVGRATFELEPRQVGKEVYTVSAPVQAREVVENNNEKDIVLRVIRDRIRILQVAGRPSWDVRFLRELLERNPNVDLISFFILRSTTDVQKADQDELALIPFPVNDLFTKELETFDIVIYQNFSYRPYRMAHYLLNIREYVRDGGSFLMVGGDQSFEPGFYAGTPIADILPVRLGGAVAWDSATYRPRLTPQGRRHPITRIGEPGQPPSAVYEGLPELEGFNGSMGLTPGARALLVHPTLPGNPPVVSIREVDRGRTMAVNTDSMWYWRFPAVADGGAGREYERFWQQSLRWLIRDPELSRVRVSTERSVVYKGEPIVADVQVLGIDYAGLEGANVAADLVPLETAREGRAQTQRTGPEGLTALRFADVEPGSYVLQVRATHEGEKIGESREPVIVAASDVEMQSPFPQPDLLKAIAEASGGTYHDVRDALGEIEVDHPRRVEVDRTLTLAIWDGPLPFVLLLLVLGAEWWLRRRGGLL